MAAEERHHGSGSQALVSRVLRLEGRVLECFGSAAGRELAPLAQQVQQVQAVVAQPVLPVAALLAVLHRRLRRH